MKIELEIESKFELDENGFEILKSAGRLEKCIRQLNVYFDADWILANRAMTFRIRFTPDARPEATLKVPVTQRGATRTMKEIEVPLQVHQSGDRFTSVPHRLLDVSRDLPAEIGAEILRLGVKSLERVGWMRNTRYLVSVGAGGHIELDRTVLPDGSTVFEVEVESADTAIHRKLSEFILKTVPWARPSHMSKFQRFRKATEAAESHVVLGRAASRGPEERDATASQGGSAARTRLKNLFRLLLKRSDK